MALDPLQHPFCSSGNNPQLVSILLLLLLLLLLFYSFESFSHQRLLVVFLWSLSDSKYSQISWTLLSILADLSNVVVWMVFTRPLISESFSPFYNPLVTVPNVPITTGLTVTFMFHSFFSSLARYRLLLLLMLLVVVVVFKKLF